MKSNLGNTASRFFLLPKASRHFEISTGAGAIREQLADSDLRIIIVGRMEGIGRRGVHRK